MSTTMESPEASKQSFDIPPQRNASTSSDDTALDSPLPHLHHHQPHHHHRDPHHHHRHVTQTSLDTTDYRGPLIPPTDPREKFRTLILCFDGTGDQFDSDNSNIVQLFSMLSKGDPERQMVYYQAGIGTYTIPQIATPFFANLSKTVDMMLATNLNHHVMGGYEFLMEHYRRGDKICIFGFSRGAYTARALAGMIHKVGLLPAGNHQQVPFAYRMYQQDDEEGWAQSVLFKRTFSVDVEIEFLGVWDTVSSVGILPRRLPFTRSNTAIRTFRHALALDEHRSKFLPSLYKPLMDRGLNLEKGLNKKVAGMAGGKAGEGITGKKHQPDHKKHTEVHAKGNLAKVFAEVTKAEHGAEHKVNEVLRPQPKKSKSKLQLEAEYTDHTKPTNVLEVWFAGCHCDVGGGSVPNFTRHSLARIPLRWMVRECFATNSGIQFEAAKLREIGLDPETVYPWVRPRPSVVDIKNIDVEDVLQDMEETGMSVVDGITNPVTAEVMHACMHLHEDDHSKCGEQCNNTLIGHEFDPEVQEPVKAPVMTEEEEELRDALSPIYDQLQISKGWWILELWPVKHVLQEDGSWVRGVGPNLGRPRVVRHQEKRPMKVHRSVKLRMEAAQKLKESHPDEAERETLQTYIPRVQFDVEPVWVD